MSTQTTTARARLSPRALWPARLLVGALAAAASAALMGMPTDVIPNDWFTRMTPVRPADVVLLILTSLALGALAATYVGGAPVSGASRGAGGGILTGLAVGCPVCNKAIVALLGTTGAVNWFGPAQPFIGAVGFGLVVWSLVLRLRAPRACPLPG